MYRILTDREKKTFKTDTGIYIIDIERKVDNKAHAKIRVMEDYQTDLIVRNRYGQEKTIADKAATAYEIIEEFYPVLLGKEEE